MIPTNLFERLLAAESARKNAIEQLQPYKHVSSPFEPETLKQFVGQDDVKNICRIMIDAAHIENRSLPNILLSGDAGVGKTTLAKILFREFGTDFILTDGATANGLVDPTGYFILDEIHNLAPEVCDRYNLLLDLGKVHIIGCTTKVGSLPKPFRSRLRHLLIDRYTDEDMFNILASVVTRKKLKYTDEALTNLATKCRYSPRVATSYLALVFDIMAVSRKKILDQGVVDRTFKYLEIDERGLLPQDRKYLASLPESGRPVGLQYLSAVLSIDGDTIQEEIEPYLMQLGLVDRGPRGRALIKDLEQELHKSVQALQEIMNG